MVCAIKQRSGAASAKRTVQAIQYILEERSLAIHGTGRYTHPGVQQMHVLPLGESVHDMATLPAYYLTGCPESLVGGILFGGKEGGAVVSPEGFR